MRRILLVWCVVVGLGGCVATRMTDLPMQPLNDQTEYAVQDNGDFMAVFVRSSRYQFFTDMAVVADECRRALNEVAKREAAKAGRQVKRIPFEGMSVSSGVNKLTGITTCTARAEAQYEGAQQTFIAARPAAQAVSAQAAAQLEQRRFHALVIGNDHYKQLNPLSTAIKDAEAVAKMLNTRFGFNVSLLTDADRQSIISAFDALRALLTEDDDLLIYYAGHGWLDPDSDRGYWLPVDAGGDGRANWLSNADISDMLKAIQAQHVMVVADSCYSGSLTRGLAITARSPGYVDRMLAKKSRTVLSSGGLEPVSDIGGNGHSVFAQAFLDVLSGSNGYVDGTQVFVDIRNAMRAKAEQTPIYSSIVRAGHELGGDFVFQSR